MTKVVFPSFVQEGFSAPEMRQFVSALEVRFQALETPTESLFAAQEENFSLVGHTHTESEITDLQTYLTNIESESIFDLSDVDGTPALNDTLVWDGSTFVSQSASGAAVALNDLTDVTVPAPIDGQVLTYNDITLVWEAAGTGAGITSFMALTDTDLTGQAQYDMVFNADGTEWQDTNGRLIWNSAVGYLQLANEHSINWQDSVGGTIELAIMTSTVPGGTPASDPNLGDVVLLVSAEDATTGGSTFAPEIGGSFTGIELSGGVTEISEAQAKFGDKSLRCNDATGPTEAYWEADAVSPDFGFGTGDFTIEFHAYFPAASTNQPFMGIWDFGTDRSWFMSMNTNTGGDFRTAFGWSSNGTDALGSASHLWGSGALDTWYHIAITRESTLIKLWLDGVNVGSNQTIGATSIHTSTTLPLQLQGNRNDGFTVESFIDNVRITKGVARYTTGFTPPAAPYDGSSGAEVFVLGDPTVATSIDGTAVDITADTTATAFRLLDNNQLRFGDAEDILMYHDGANAMVVEDNSGVITDFDILKMQLFVNSQANNNSFLGIGEQTTLRGDSQHAVLNMYGEQTGAIAFTALREQGDAFWIDSPHRIQIDTGATDNIEFNTAALKLLEAAAAPADELTYGQWWVRDDQTPMFTDELGNDFELNNVPVGTTTDATLRWSGTEWVENTGLLAFTTGNIQSGSHNILDTTAGVQLEESDASATNKVWTWAAGSELMWMSTTTDASGFGAYIWKVDRTGTVVNNMDVLTEFRIKDIGDTDYVAFAHDGTDLNITGINTGVINVDTPLELSTSVSGTSNAINLNSTGPGIWWFENDQATDTGGWKMYGSAGEFRFYLTNDSGTVVDAIMICNRTADVHDETIFYANGLQAMVIRHRDSTGITSAVGIRDHQGTLHDAGFNVLDQEGNNTSFTLAAQHCGMQSLKTTATVRTITLPGSGSTDFPVDGVFTYMNRVTSGTGGNVTINASTNSATLYWLDGTTLQGGASTNRTLGPGGVMTICRQSTTTWSMWGGGIS